LRPRATPPVNLAVWRGVELPDDHRVAPRPQIQARRLRHLANVMRLRTRLFFKPFPANTPLIGDRPASLHPVSLQPTSDEPGHHVLPPDEPLVPSGLGAYPDLGVPVPPHPEHARRGNPQ